MKQSLLALITLCTLLSSCGNDCDPGPAVTDQTLVFNITKSGRSLIKKTLINGVFALPDSIKIYALGSNVALPLASIADSLMSFGDYTKNVSLNTSIQNYRLVIGNLMPDTISIVVNKGTYTDRCGTSYSPFEIGQTKVNNIVNTPIGGVNTMAK